MSDTIKWEKVTFNACYENWSKAEEILSQAIGDGVPDDKLQIVQKCQNAILIELRKIEDSLLQESEEKYTALTAEIKARKADLEKVKAESDAIVTAAGQAEQLIGLLTKLIPLLA